MGLTARFRPLFPITETRSYLFAGGLAPAAIPVRAASTSGRTGGCTIPLTIGPATLTSGRY